MISTLLAVAFVKSISYERTFHFHSPNAEIDLGVRDDFVVKLNATGDIESTERTTVGTRFKQDFVPGKPGEPPVVTKWARGLRPEQSDAAEEIFWRVLEVGRKGLVGRTFYAATNSGRAAAFLNVTRGAERRLRFTYQEQEVSPAVTVTGEFEFDPAGGWPTKLNATATDMPLPGGTERATLTINLQRPTAKM